MLTTLFLSTLLMMGGLGGAAVSHLQVYGKSMQSDKTLSSSDDGRQNMRKQMQQKVKSDVSRSLGLQSFSMQVTPPTSKNSLPTIIKFYPPTVKPLNKHPNMPMRFGRDDNSGDDRTPNSTPNMPQRFGRSHLCVECAGIRLALKQHQRLGRNNPYWSLLRTDVFDFTTSSEVMEMPEENL